MTLDQRWRGGGGDLRRRHRLHLHGRGRGRYFLNAPLNWSGDISGYLLCACAFLALPKVTKDGAHVAITFVLERMGEKSGAPYSYVLRLVTGVACFAGGIIVAYEGVQLYTEHVLTTRRPRSPNG